MVECLKVHRHVATRVGVPEECLQCLFGTLITEIQRPPQGFPGGTVVKNPSVNAGDARESRVQSLGREDPFEKEMTTCSSILAWREPGQFTVHGFTSWTWPSN